jgi:hypothetical protein
MGFLKTEMKQTTNKSEQVMSEIIIEAHTSMIKMSAKSGAWTQILNRNKVDN